MIVHWGNFDWSAHYTALVKKGNKYILANDEISSGIKWPTCGYAEKTVADGVRKGTPSVLFYRKAQ